MATSKKKSAKVAAKKSPRRKPSSRTSVNAKKARAKTASATSGTRKRSKTPSPKASAPKQFPVRAEAPKTGQVPFTHARALELFRSLGAKDAERLATYEASGDPALARWLFLTGMWSMVVQDDTTWPGRWADANAPIPAAIRRMLDRGIDPQDLTDVVRDAQIDALYNVAQLLEHCGHGIEEQQAKIAENVEWRLVEYDGNTGEMRRVIGGLHEDFFDMDPTGRGGQPRPR
jgi:hypothetical protein